LSNSLLCLINKRQTKPHFVYITSFNAYYRLHKLPISVKNRLSKIVYLGVAQKLLAGLMLKDVKMMAEEQFTDLQHQGIQNDQLNCELLNVKRLIKTQVDKLGCYLLKGSRM
jgi:hypothetical protein